MNNPMVLSVVVLTHNEQENIEECLKCLGQLKTQHEVLVIDDESTDETVEIVTRLGAKVINHALNGDFAQQRNFALTQTKGEWVFFLDADERVSKELVNEMEASISDNNISGAYFKRHDYFGGRLLRYGEIGGIRLLRLARRNSGLWVGKVDEKWSVAGDTITFTNPILHYSHPDLTQFLDNINERSTLNAQQLFDKGSKTRWYDWGKPVIKFIINYFIRLGYLDRLPGFVFAVLMSFHSFLVRGKLYLLWKRQK